MDDDRDFEAAEVLDRLRAMGWGRYLDALDGDVFTRDGKRLYSRVAERLGMNAQKVKIELERLRIAALRLCGDLDVDQDAE